MAVAYKVLGQSAPAAALQTTLYTVPASTQAVVSTINVCNMGAVASTFRIAVRPAGATLNPLHYLAYDVNVPATDSIALTLGITLATTDILAIYSNTGTVAFSAFGSEIT